MRSLMLGQDTPFVLLGLCGVYSALKREYEVWAGLSLLLVALRPSLLPAILIVLLLQGYIRTLTVFAGSMLALAVLAMPLLGIDWIGRYLGFLFSPASTAPGEQTPAHSWLGFANEVLGSWSPALVPVVFVLLAVASAAVLVWARRRAAETETAEEPTAAPFSDPGFSFDYEPGWDLLWARRVPPKTTWRCWCSQPGSSGLTPPPGSGRRQSPGCGLPRCRSATCSLHWQRMPRSTRGRTR
jgi:hypothetical protein